MKKSLKQSKLSRCLVASTTVGTLLFASLAQAASYVESQDYADYIALLAKMSNAELMSYELPAELGLTTAECGAAVGLLGFTAAIDSAPALGLFKSELSLTNSTQAMTSKVGDIITASAGKLKLADAPFISSMLAALKGVGAKAMEWDAKYLGNFLVNAAPYAAKDAVYAERIAGAVVGYRESHPKSFMDFLNVIGPHIAGGVVATIAELPVSSLRAMVDKDYKFDMPLTREAYNLTRTVGRLTFSDSGGCRQHWLNYNAVVNELMMRAGRMARPAAPPVTTTDNPSGPVININIGNTGNPAVSDRRLPTDRPYGGRDNGAQDFRPAKSVSRAN